MTDATLVGTGLLSAGMGVPWVASSKVMSISLWLETWNTLWRAGSTSAENYETKGKHCRAGQQCQYLHSSRRWTLPIMIPGGSLLVASMVKRSGGDGGTPCEKEHRRPETGTTQPTCEPNWQVPCAEVSRSASVTEAGRGRLAALADEKRGGEHSRRAHSSHHAWRAAEEDEWARLTRPGERCAESEGAAHQHCHTPRRP
ncbi:hypothetical protein CALVIDRAFT_166903 [Calocera viscosa TUFC12733]|uniref:Uncharacterized protein n=1 Tax=Calocera viscosa (strain TUFC12733) TaxID=1330018 RepID=A0A167L4X3_CALVF|nr:hypothetical protein CALVIDRAFT_166903 [Calocera viscosa TUFC12733]